MKPITSGKRTFYTIKCVLPTRARMVRIYTILGFGRTGFGREDSLPVCIETIKYAKLAHDIK